MKTLKGKIISTAFVVMGIYIALDPNITRKLVKG